MGIFEESTEFENCFKVNFADRLRALQESTTNWQQVRRDQSVENVSSSLKERRKLFTNDAEENKAPASFVLQKAPLRRTQFDQIKPFETIKVVKRPAPESQPIDDKSSELSCCPKPSHHIEVNKPRLPATDDAKNNNDESQILKRREENHCSMSEKDVEEKEVAERPSHFLPTTKRTVTRPGRRVPTRFQNAADAGSLPTVSLNSELHLETEDKENQEKPVTLKKSNLRVSSTVPFQLPVVGKDHCGVQLRNVDKSAPFPDPMLIRALCVEKHVDLRLVQPVKQSVAEQGSYLLVTAKKLIMRHGKDATVQERAKVAQLAHEVIAGKEMFGYCGKPDLANEDGLSDAAFWHNLNASEEQPEMVDDIQQSYQKSFAFYQIEDSGEQKQVECESVSNFVPDSNQMYVLDFGSEIYTWLGRNCKRSLAKFASELVEKLKTTPLPHEMNQFINANQEDQKRPLWILCRRLSEGVADSLFRHKFALNVPPPKPSGIHLKTTETHSQIGKLSTNFPTNLRLKPTVAKTHQLKDEDVLARELATKFAQSTPTKDYFLELEDTQIRPFDPNVFTEQLNFFVLNGEKLERLGEQPEEFDCRKCYVIEWRYRVERPGVRKLNHDEAKKHETGRERGVYFYWLGQNSTVKEQSFCALALRNMDRERLEHIRVEQGHEHPLFISLFNGFIVSGTDTQFFLFHSYGPDGNLLAVIEMRGHCGRSQTAMAQIVDNKLICQRGENCPQGVWESAQKLAEKFANIRQLTLECLETSDFECLKPLSWNQAPRFYRVYELEGEQLLQNRAHFTFPAHQSDFKNDGCILVENDENLWLWSNGVTSTFALKVANNFWTLERKMNPETSAKVLCKGNEPSEFMALFPEWKSDESESNTARAQSLAQLLKERTTTRSLQEVREKKLPEGCDLKRLELYLSDEDFESVFKMSKDEFSKLQEWKQIRLKKERGLF